MSTFVSVGNAKQPFDRLLNAVQSAAAELPQPVVVQHGVTPISSETFRFVTYLNMSEFEKLIHNSDLLVMHAGAGSVIHAIRAGKVPIVMPRRACYGEHVDDHQVEFSAALEGMGKLVMVSDAEQLRDAVKVVLARQKEIKANLQPSKMVDLIGEVLGKYAKNFD